METAIFLALSIEAVVQYVAEAINGGLNWQKIVAGLLGVALSVGYGWNVIDFAAIGLVAQVPVLAAVLNAVFTGALLGRGAGFLNDFYQAVNARRV